MAAPTVRTDCFIYQLLPGRGPAYDAYHSDVWPEVRAAARMAGIVEHAIYRRGELVISVATCVVTPSSRPILADLQLKNREWSALMAPLFATVSDAAGEPLYATEIYHDPWR